MCFAVRCLRLDPCLAEVIASIRPQCTAAPSFDCKCFSCSRPLQAFEAEVPPPDRERGFCRVGASLQAEDPPRGLRMGGMQVHAFKRSCETGRSPACCRFSSDLRLILTSTPGTSRSGRAGAHAVLCRPSTDCSCFCVCFWEPSPDLRET